MEEGAYTYTSKEFRLLGTCPRKRVERKGYEGPRSMIEYLNVKIMRKRQNANRECGEARGTGVPEGESWRRVHTRTLRRSSTFWAHVLENGLREPDR